MRFKLFVVLSCTYVAQIMALALCPVTLHSSLCGGLHHDTTLQLSLHSLHSSMDTLHSSLSGGLPHDHDSPFSFLLSRSWLEVLEPNSVSKFDYDTVEESFQEVVADEALNLFDILRQATTTKDTSTAIALAISDFVSGYSSGLVSRASASLLGDEKKDKSVTKASSTAAFFGIRGLIRGAGLTLGIPRPIVLVLASALASFASERTKIDSRERESRSSKDSSRDKDNDNDEEENVEVLSKPELAGDISKWITFDTLLESLPTEMIDSGLRKNLLYFGIGSFSSTIGLGVNKFTAAQERPRVRKGARTKDAEQVKEELIKLCSSSFEGGVLFFAYSFLSYLIAQVLPSDLKNEFLFSKYLDSVETSLEDIVIQKKMGLVPNPFAPFRFR